LIANNSALHLVLFHISYIKMPSLTLGSTAPDFSLLDQDGQLQSLSKILQKKAVVLYFYPKDETYGCTKEACAFRDTHEVFTDMGAEVIGISADDVNSHARFANRHQLPFLLLSDPQRKVHELYGVERGFFGLVSARVTFVIDRQGIIRQTFDSLINFNGHVEASLAILKQGLAPS
jgi:thioredoxin-dependent peroxiredoxin